MLRNSELFLLMWISVSACPRAPSTQWMGSTSPLWPHLKTTPRCQHRPHYPQVWQSGLLTFSVGDLNVFTFASHVILPLGFQSAVLLSRVLGEFESFGTSWTLISCLDSSQVCKSDQRPSTLPVGPVVTVMGSLQTPTPNSTGGSSAV